MSQPFLALNDSSKFSPPHIFNPGSYIPMSLKKSVRIANADPTAITPLKYKQHGLSILACVIKVDTLSAHPVEILTP